MDRCKVRRPTRSDAALVAALVSAYDAEFALPGETSPDELLGEWANVDLARDAWLVEAGPGEAAAYAMVESMSPAFLRADGYVHPAFACRGLGGLLVQLTEGRARELASGSAPGTRVVLHNTTLLEDEPAQALLTAAGYLAVNWSYRMATELREAPGLPVWPDGIAVRSLDPARDLAALHEASSEAFAEHFGGPRSPERFEAEIAGPGFDPGLWFLAEDGPEIAGTVECLRRAGHGHIRYLGILEPWRGRGLGTALLLHALGELYRRGERRVTLGVDANNPHGAARLYERLGMSVEFAAVTFEKELRPAPEPAGQ